MDIYFDKEGLPISMMRWEELRHTGDGLTGYSRIGLREFEGGVHVSTVWLGIDHSFGSGELLIFETMIFGGDNYPYHEATMRYSTEYAALEGHNRTCADIEAGVRPWFLRPDL